MKKYNYEITGIRTQINKDGHTTTVWTKKDCWITKSSATKEHHALLAKIRKHNKMSEVDKLIATAKEFGGNVPEVRQNINIMEM